MQNKLPQEPVSLSFIEADFVVVALDINHCSTEVKWLRQVNGEEYRRGLEIALSISAELKAELRKTLALVQT